MERKPSIPAVDRLFIEEVDNVIKSQSIVQNISTTWHSRGTSPAQARVQKLLSNWLKLILISCKMDFYILRRQ